MSTSAPPKYR